jgi:hypothetical protein
MGMNAEISSLDAEFPPLLGRLGSKVSEAEFNQLFHSAIGISQQPQFLLHFRFLITQLVVKVLDIWVNRLADYEVVLLF